MFFLEGDGVSFTLFLRVVEGGDDLHYVLLKGLKGAVLFDSHCLDSGGGEDNRRVEELADDNAVRKREHNPAYVGAEFVLLPQLNIWPCNWA